MANHPVLPTPLSTSTVPKHFPKFPILHNTFFFAYKNIHIYSHNKKARCKTSAYRNGQLTLFKCNPLSDDEDD